MSLVEYNLALSYSLETYARRDLVYVMSKIYGDKKGNKGKDTFGFTIEHPEIEAYIRESYNKEESE